MRSSDLKKKRDRSVQGRRKVWKCGVRGFLIILLHLRRKKMSRKREPFSINFCFFVHKYFAFWVIIVQITEFWEQRTFSAKYWLLWLEIVDSHDWLWCQFSRKTIENETRKWRVGVWVYMMKSRNFVRSVV